LQLGHQLAVLADKVGLDLQAEGQIAAMTQLGDLPELIGRLRDVLPGVGALGVIEREPANQLRLEGMGQLAGLLHFLAQVLLERHKPVLCAIFLVEQLYFADRRAEGCDVQVIRVFQVPNSRDFPW
jgi:hypothetical protein